MTEPKIIHLYIYSRVRNRFGCGRLNREYVLEWIGRYLPKIPKRHYPQILKEMDEMNLITISTKRVVLVNECEPALLRQLEYALW